MRNLKVVEWLNEPVTQVFINVLKEHLTADKDLLMSLLFDSSSLKDLDLFMCSQLKGQVATLERVIDVHDLLTEEDLKPLEDL